MYDLNYIVRIKICSSTSLLNIFHVTCLRFFFFFFSKIGKLKKKKMNISLGIDLGTSNSGIAVYKKNGKVEIIEAGSKNLYIPSVVGISENDFVVGENAKEASGVDDKMVVISSAKRLVGRLVGDPILDEEFKQISYNLEKVPDKKPRYILGIEGKPRTTIPEEVEAFVLEELYQKFVAKTPKESEKIKNVVIGIPATFNQRQRSATKNSGYLAGFEKVDIVIEPTAAAIKYATTVKPEEKENVLVFDFGAGTLDITIMEIDGNKYTVLYTDGLPHLGGDDIDHAIFSYFNEKIMEESDYAVDMSQPDDDLQKREARKLRLLCEDMKIHLSSTKSQSRDFQYTVNGETRTMNLILTQNNLNSIIEDNIFPSLDPLFEKIKSYQKGPKNTKKFIINKILLVGGCSQIPIIGDKLVETFSDDECELIDTKIINPMTAVSEGAAIYGAMKSKNIDIQILERTVLMIGIRSGSAINMCIPANTPKPAIQKEWDLYKTTKGNCKLLQIDVYEAEKETTPLRQAFHIGRFLFNGLQALDPSKENFYLKVSMTDQDIEVLFARNINGEQTKMENKLKSAGIYREDVLNILRGEMREIRNVK